MLKLLKFEFHKLIRQKSTYICILIPFIFLFLGILINKLIYMNDNAQIPTTINILKISLATTNLTLILAIFIAINVTEDYTEQTIKNIYGKGYSREFVYLTKYIIIILYTLINVIIIYLSSLLICNIFFELGNIDNLIINLISQAIIIMAIIYTFIFFVSGLIINKKQTI